jgi:hypothetical protein
MKKVLTLCLMMGLIWALPRDKAFIDNGESLDGPHRQLPLYRQGAQVLIDSSGNGYSAWTKAQECLAYNPTLTALQFVNRGYSPTGILYTHQTDNTFSFWVNDLVYNAGLGNARYPTSVASDDGSSNGPHISMPVLLDPPSWGYQVAQYESGGWWASFWDTEVDLGPGDLDVHKNIGKQLPNGNILFIGNTEADALLWETWDPGLTGEISSGVLASAMNYFGFDVNAGIAYVFYYDASLNVYYQTTTDGVTWSGQQTYNMVWPTPYTNNSLFWTQMALTDAGDPILVFDMQDGDDLTYPVDGVVYVSTAEGSPCIAVSQTGGQAFWGTIATGGNYVVVLYQYPYSTLPDSTAEHDQWYNWSTDNGATWDGPVRLTDSSVRTGLGQLAKRVDATNGNFFYFYGVTLVGDWDPFWITGLGSGGIELTPHAWYVGWHPVVGVEEHGTETPSRLALTIGNPVSVHAHVSYALPNASDVSLKLFDRSGRLVNTIDQGHKEAGVHELNINTHDLASGTYILMLDTPTSTESGALVVIH